MTAVEKFPALRAWAAILWLALPVARSAEDGYPRHVVTPELGRLMTAGLPEAFRARSAKIGDPLPAHIVQYEDQVRWLIERIDERPEYADHLKYGYILRRWPGQWPVAEALRLIEDRLDAEERANLLAFAEGGETAKRPSVSRGWLRLASVAAFARAVENRPDGWRGAYRRLWANDEALAKYPEVFRAVLQDYVGEATGGRNAGAAAKPSVAMIKEFDDWFRRWLAVEPTFTHEPEVGRFVLRFGLEDKARSTIASMRPGAGDSFVFFFRAGRLLCALAPDVDPEDDSGQAFLMAALKAGDFYGQEAGLRRRAYAEAAERLARGRRWAEAIDILRRARAEGLASPFRLAELAHGAWRASEQASLGSDGSGTIPATRKEATRWRQLRDEALAAALAETPPPEDVAGLAGILVALGRPEEAEACLLRFLENPPERRGLVWYEAALRLAQWQAKTGRSGQAERWLAVWQTVTASPTPKALSLYAESQALRQRLGLVNETKQPDSSPSTSKGNKR